MSSFTGLFSQGGGGGETNIVTEPSKLPKYGIARLGSKSLNSNIQIGDTSASNWWYYQQFSDHISLADVSADNTYTTLLNVSNAKGGFLHWVLSPAASATNPSVYIKFTVDGGDPQEFSYNWNAVNSPPEAHQRLLMGGGVSGTTPMIYSSDNVNAKMFNPYATYGSSENGSHGSLVYDDPTNKVYGMGIGTVYYYSDFSTNNNLNTYRLAFTSSLKIEVKQQVLHTTFQNNKAICYFTLH